MHTLITIKRIRFKLNMIMNNVFGNILDNGCASYNNYSKKRYT